MYKIKYTGLSFKKCTGLWRKPAIEIQLSKYFKNTFVLRSPLCFGANAFRSRSSGAQAVSCFEGPATVRCVRKGAVGLSLAVTGAEDIDVVRCSHS